MDQLEPILDAAEIEPEVKPLPSDDKTSPDPAPAQVPTLTDAELDAWARGRVASQQKQTPVQEPVSSVTTPDLPDDWDDWSIADQTRHLHEQLTQQRAAMMQMRQGAVADSLQMVAPILEQNLVGRVADALPAEARDQVAAMVREAVGTNVQALPTILNDPKTIGLLQDAARGRYYAKLEAENRPRPGEPNPGMVSGGADAGVTARIDQIERTFGVKFSAKEREEMIASGEIK